MKRKNKVILMLLVFAMAFAMLLASCSAMIDDFGTANPSVVTTFAGTGFAGSVNGTGTAASFDMPYGITTDGTNLYVTDSNNHLIRQVVISTGEVTTIAGTGSAGSADGTGTAASFNHPFGITTDGTNLYVADTINHSIRKIIISTGEVTTIAGTGSTGFADGIGTAASFDMPYGIITDGTNLYVTDSKNYSIRKVVISTGEVTTIAGTGSAGSADGTGTAASFDIPYGITTDGTNLYVADSKNHSIRQVVISTGEVTTIAGTGSAGSADGTGTAASFYLPNGITTDGTNLYVADTLNNLIRKIIISTGEVTTIAGTGSEGSSDGAFADASFNCPFDITLNGSDAYVADTYNHSIRKLSFVE